jgi:hypothetical protein
MLEKKTKAKINKKTKMRTGGMDQVIEHLLC